MEKGKKPQTTSELMAFKLTPQMRKALEAEAALQDRPMSYIIRKAIARFLNEKAPRAGNTTGRDTTDAASV